MTVQPPHPPFIGPAKFHGGAQADPFRRVVIHATVSPCENGGARAVARYFRTTVTRPSSAHYVVDPGAVIQCVGDHVVAYHAPPNEDSIGVELCDPMPTANGREIHLDRWHDANHRAMLDQAAELVARLCLAYGVPIRKVGPVMLKLGRRGICGHADVSHAWNQSAHWDPGAGFPWPTFIRQVRDHADKLRRGATADPKPAQDAADTTFQPSGRVKVAADQLRKAREHAGRPQRRAWLTRLLRIIGRGP